MDFGIEDALDSDDSFFEDPKPSAKRPSITKTTEKEKKTIDDLFNFMDQTTLSKKNEADDAPQARFNLSSTTEKKDSVPLANKAQSKSLDFLDDLLSIPSTKVPQEKPTDLLEDILPTKSLLKKPETQSKKQTPSITFSDILKDSKASSTIDKTEDQPPQNSRRLGSEQKPQIGPSSLEGPFKKAPMGRRGSRSTPTGVEDVLGIFGGSSVDQVKSSDASKSSVNVIKDNKDVPDWLGGSSTMTAKSDTTIVTQKIDKSSVSETKSEGNIASSKELQKEEVLARSSDSIITNYDTNTLHNSYSNLQQQESLLLVSLQMKKYEENLDAIKTRQEEILQKQTDQFDLLLHKYVARQQSIEEEVRLQQERINSHIKMLLTDDSRIVRKRIEQEDRDKNVGEGRNNDEVAENFVKVLKQRYDEEMFLVEESYKKQLLMLEASAEAVEKRLNVDIEKLTTGFEEKIASLHKTYKEEIETHAEKIRKIEENHKEELREIKDNHYRTIEELKNDHFKQIEYIKEQMKIETELLHDKNSLSQKLENNVQILENNSQILSNLQDNVSRSYNVFSIAKEKSIEAKEKEITMMRKYLEECREKAETERSQLMGLVRTLETKIAEQNHIAKEERWALSQAASTLAARSAALDRESQYNRDSLERDREQLKTLKQIVLQEQEAMILKLTEEKLQLTAEKQRFEISKKLTNNYEIEKIKTEAETAIQAAKELSEQLNLERQSLQRKKNEIEQTRKKIIEKENELIQKETELEYLTKNAEEKLNESRKNVTEAKYLEQKYQEKLSELQAQNRMLVNREKKFAEEKLWLSKERLILYNNRRNYCGLCKNGSGDPQMLLRGDNFVETNTDDVDAIRIRLELGDEDKNNEVSREDNSNRVY